MDTESPVIATQVADNASQEQAHPDVIVFTDVDGTLIDSHKQVPGDSAQIIREVYASGVPFCPVSARSPHGIDPIWKQLGFHGPLAAFSGAYVIDEEGRELYSKTIPLEEAIQVKWFLNSELAGVVVNTFAFDTWATDDKSSPRVQSEENTVELQAVQCRDLTQAFDERGIHKFLVMGDPDDLTVAEEQIRERYGSLSVARSNANLLEIMAAGATKEHAIDVLCRHYGMDRTHAVAFGDGHNDIPMLKAVPTSYAVANASDEVKRAAAFTCAETNAQGAVAHTLQELLCGMGAEEASEEI